MHQHSHPHADPSLHDTLYLDLITQAWHNAHADDCHEQPEVDPTRTWIRVYCPGSAQRSQGWKLHVSASIWSAPEVLRRVLPVLIAETTRFKVTASPQVLAQLNVGEAGMSQVAKFITVYPNDDVQAVRIAEALHEATRGLKGPRILSDRQLAPGSLVHYRYGGFSNRYVQMQAGEVLPAISTPAGELVPDRRAAHYIPPAWVVDPFVAAGVTAEPDDKLPTPGRPYRVVKLLHRSPRGEVYLAIDLVAARRCVLKRAHAHASQDEHGRDARDRLRYEAEVLSRMDRSAAVPVVYELIENDAEGDTWLAMEDVDGVGLDRYLMHAYATGRPIEDPTVIGWGLQLAQILGGMHAARLVYRDLKPSNIILAPDGRLRLIDFEMTHDVSKTEPAFGLGTPGYMSPQQRAHAKPSPADDIYALGAVLYFAATGADPSGTPAWGKLLDRPPGLLNPSLSASLADVIERCLASSQSQRYATMQAVERALEDVQPVAVDYRADPLALSKRTLATLARRLGDTLCATAREAGDSRVAWPNEHRAGLPIAYRTIDVGAAGIVLGLGELVAEFGDPSHRAVLERAANWLVASKPPEGPLNAGLYVGEAGVGAALLHSGQILGKPELVAAAVERGRIVAGAPLASPDLYNGAAGRLLFHLTLWDATADHQHLDAALSVGDWLVASAERVAEGELRWRFPSGFGGFADQAFAGYAHGAAGIADVLLELFAATGQARFRETALAAARWLMRIALPTLADGSGLDWPAYEGGTARGGLWCHGATGIGRFFLHAAQLDLVPGAAEIAAAAARMVARGTRWSAPVQCHGLAGTIEFLVDMYRATRDTEYLTEAHAHARLLQTFATERDGQLVFSSDAPNEYTPSFMLGYAGVAACLLRMMEPDRLPHVISRAGFQRHALRNEGYN